VLGVVGDQIKERWLRGGNAPDELRILGREPEANRPPERDARNMGGSKIQVLDQDGQFGRILPDPPPRNRFGREIASSSRRPGAATAAMARACSTSIPHHHRRSTRVLAGEIGRVTRSSASRSGRA
jgi:hypothetical protein